MGCEVSRIAQAIEAGPVPDKPISQIKTSPSSIRSTVLDYETASDSEDSGIECVAIASARDRVLLRQYRASSLHVKRVLSSQSCTIRRLRNNGDAITTITPHGVRSWNARRGYSDKAFHYGNWYDGPVTQRKPGYQRQPY